MKRNILTAVLGVMAVTPAFGAGSIYFDNYTQGTYNQVCYPNGTPVLTALPLQLYYQKGTGFTDLSQLIAGVTTTVDPTRTFVGANGPGGWFSGPVQVLPTWQPGDVFTFCVVVVGDGTQSAFWTESGAIHPTVNPQSGFLNFPGINAPEPSAFALFGVAGFVWAMSRSSRSLKP
jgi:hypothetical protein